MVRLFEDFKYIKQILLEPSKFFEGIDKQDIGTLFKFFATMSIILFIESMVFTLLLSLLGLSFLSLLSESIPLFGGLSGAGLMIVLHVILYFVFITFGFLMVLINAGIVHIFAYLFGCKNGYRATLTALVLGSTPLLVLGGIPIIGALAGLYSLVLQVIGLSKLHKISWPKALLVILLPAIIILIIVFVLVFIFIGTLLTSGELQQIGLLSNTTLPLNPIELPTDFPSNVPLPTDALPFSYLTGGEVKTVIFVSDDSFGDIYNFYVDELTKSGWTLESKLKSVKAEKSFALLTASKSSNKLQIVLTADNGGQYKNKTLITISYGEKML